MDISVLEGFGIKQKIIEIWKKNLGNNLLPVQIKALIQHHVLQGGNLIVFAPTSSGKTFVGEMAAINSATKGKQVFFLVPLKAMAHEKYEEFKERYQGCKLDIVLSTRDYNRDDEKIREEQFHIAIIVYEKLQGLLVHRPFLLDNVGLVVIDELQMIIDETRGPNLELLLTKILLNKNKPQILGLSAVLGKAETLANWLNAGLLVEDKRPIELRKGILHQETFHFKEHNSGQENNEKIIPVEIDTDDDKVIIETAAAEFARRRESTLVFLSDKASTVRFASLLSDRVDLPPAEKALRELDSYEPSAAKKMVKGFMEKGVAFHNSDLGWEYRALVEQAFRDGEVMVLASTPTLAMGMNLPAINVIVNQRKWNYDIHADRWRKIPITRMEFENMSGRAGRFAAKRDFGRALIATHSEFNIDVIKDLYITKEFEDIKPPLENLGIEEQVLNIVASGLVKSEEDIVTFLLGSFTGQELWQKEMTTSAFEIMIRDAIGKCINARLMEKTPEDNYLATNEGKVAAIKGVKVSTARDILKFLDAVDDLVIQPIEVFFLIGRTEDGAFMYTNMATDEPVIEKYVENLHRRLNELDISHHRSFDNYFTRRSRSFEDIKIAKKALLLESWINETPIEQMEKQFHLMEGSIRRIAQEYAWLVDTIMKIMSVLEWDESYISAMDNLRIRLHSGVTAEATELGQLQVRGLGRVSTRRLIDAGLNTIEALKQASLETLHKILKNKPLSSRLVEALKLYEISEEEQEDLEEPEIADNEDDDSAEDEQHDEEYPVVLELDPRNLHVSFYGIEFDLPKAAFDIIEFLARNPGCYHTTRQIAQVVYGADNLDSYFRQVYDQIKIIRNNAEKAFRDKDEESVIARQIVINKRKAGYAVNVPKQSIRVFQTT